MTVVASNPRVTKGVIPDRLPPEPGSFDISVQQKAAPFGMSFSYPTVQCAPGAYAVLTNAGQSARGGTTESESYTGCVYVYAGGVRAHIVLVSTTQQATGLQGMVNQAVKSGIAGSNEEYSETRLDHVTSKLVSLVPSAKIVKTSKPASASAK
jgi:hypothetical protein